VRQPSPGAAHLFIGLRKSYRLWSRRDSAIFAADYPPPRGIFVTMNSGGTNRRKANRLSKPNCEAIFEPLEPRSLLSAGSPAGNYGVDGVVAGPAFDKTHVLGGGYQAVLVQPDQRVVVGDTVSVKGHDVFFLRRYNAGGGVDATFGTNGLVELSVPQRDLLLTGLTLQPDGKIVASGTVDTSNTAAGINTTIAGEVIARFTTAGRPDGTFGNRGVVTLAVANGAAQSLATTVTVAVQNGELLVTSPTRIDRLTPAGAIDLAFTPITAAAVSATAQFVSTAVDFSGNIVVGLNTDAGVVRYEPNGAIDPSFGNAGTFADAELPLDRVTQILPRGDGSILLMTAHDTGTSRGDDLIDLTSAGAVDTAFTDAGIVPTLTGADFGSPAVSVVQQFDGKLLVTSPAFGPAENSYPNGFIVQRFMPDGSVDPTFGTGGMATFDGAVVAGRAAGATLDSAGRLVVSAGNATLVAIDTTGAGGTITGTVFSDNNGNHVFNGAESGIAGAAVFIDYNNDGQFDGADVQATADASGHFSFADVPAGRYTVRDEPVAGYTLTAKPMTVTVVANQTAANVNFAQLPLGSIIGTVTAGVLPLAGVGVFIDVNHNGVYNATKDTLATTDSTGTFQFASLPRGTYRVIEIVPAGYRRIVPKKSAAVGVKVGIGQTVGGVTFSDVTV
jgi:uncharacterized delta-60 repeat protein